ncbi:hypothetical protein QPK31_02775 [Massilia sp. YIM B02769]|uniref:hypothetical protein n=1 Tax=Massilia sp. YIM B02769 TaxID=3050129 RepID=UPI0025B66FD6|nr:hypothetical protein [Massilia sp. YIM B02769]MDN4057141.1 hypothetical protein [Massilia sp. YIM B02769]
MSAQSTQPQQPPVQSNMPNNAPLQIISTEVDRPHDTIRKSLDRRHRDRAPINTELERLRAVAHYQGLLIELLNEKVGNGNA